MTRRRLYLMGLLLLAVLAAAVVFLWLGSAMQEHRLDTYQQLLGHDDPRQRLEAAQGILDIEPENEKVRLVQARAMIQLHRYAAARESLRRITQNANSPNRNEAWRILADSYLVETAQVIAGGTPTNIDLIADRVEPMLIESDGIRKALASSPETMEQALVLQAREIDLRAALLRARLSSYYLDLTRARAVESEEQIHQAGVQVSNLQSQILQLDQSLQQVCKQAIQRNAQDPTPQVLLMGMSLRQGDLAKARTIARELADRDSLTYVAAGSVADTLLWIEHLYGLHRTQSDLDTASRLLLHPKLTGLRNLEYRLAKVELSLALNKYPEAQKQAEEILATFDDQPRAISQLARAMAAQGQADKALKLLQPVAERVRSAELHLTMAQCALRSGQVKAGREYLRQALELRSDLLPARLLLVQSLVEDGHVLEAEPDILTAVGQSPDHPQVLAIQARLLIEKSDAPGLLRLIQRRLAAQPPIQAREIELAAAMVCDDKALVGQLSKTLMEASSTDPLAVISKGWTLADGERRAAIAALMAQALLEHLCADPMLLADAPPLADRADTSASLASQGGPGKPDMTLLSRSYFAPWSQQTALLAVELALDRWPDEPGLIHAALALSLMLDQPKAVKQWLDRMASAPQPSIYPAVAAYLDGDALELKSRLDALGSSPVSYSPLRQWLEIATAVKTGKYEEAQAVLEKYLRNHPWDELAVLHVVRPMVQAGQIEAGRSVLENVRKINPRLTLLVSGRVSLALGQTLGALHDLEMLVADEPGGSEIRRQAAEVRARVGLTDGRIEIAAGLFENLALSAPHRRLPMQVAAIDVLRQGGRTPGAIAGLTTALADNRTPPLWLDQLLYRANLILPPGRALQLVDNLIKYRPDEPILLVYKAQWLAASKDGVGAKVVADRLTQLFPQSPRIILLRARLANAAGDTAASLEAYHQLLNKGGTFTKAAAWDMEQSVAIPNSPPALNSEPASDRGAKP